MPESQGDSRGESWKQGQGVPEQENVDPKTGGSKNSKPEEVDLVDPEFIRAVARVLHIGKLKYEARNWERGYRWGLSYAAAQRHMLAFWSGEDTDPDSGLPHIAHAATHMMFLLLFSTHEQYADHDDRSKIGDV